VSGDPLRLALDRNAPEDTADYGGTGNPDTARGPDETYCRNCGRLALDHGPARYSIYGACPPKPAEPSVRDRAAEVLHKSPITMDDVSMVLADGAHRLTTKGARRLADALAAAGLLAGGLTINTDPKPQPGDGPEYHADLAAWHERHQPKHRKEGTP